MTTHRRGEGAGRQEESGRQQMLSENQAPELLYNF